MKTRQFLLALILVVVFTGFGCGKMDFNIHWDEPIYIPKKITIEKFHFITFQTSTYTGVSYGYWADSSYRSPYAYGGRKGDSVNTIHINSASREFPNSPSNILISLDGIKRDTGTVGNYSVAASIGGIVSVEIPDLNTRYYTADGGIVSIDSIGRSQSLGSYAVGQYRVMVYDSQDTSKKPFPAWGSFRVLLIN